MNFFKALIAYIVWPFYIISDYFISFEYLTIFKLNIYFNSYFNDPASFIWHI